MIPTSLAFLEAGVRVSPGEAEVHLTLVNDCLLLQCALSPLFLQCLILYSSSGSFGDLIIWKINERAEDKFLFSFLKKKLHPSE